MSDLNMIHLIQWGPHVQALLTTLTGEHRVNRPTVGLSLSPSGAASRESSGSRIEPVESNGALRCLGVHANSALGHLICMCWPGPSRE